jgi:inorganic triphosphatase YgiF
MPPAIDEGRLVRCFGGRGTAPVHGKNPKTIAMADPVEIELKFQVPQAARERVRRAVATASATVTRLQAIYADTADDRLAGASMALRLRKEGRIWVQTLKGRGDGLMQRLEDEHRLPAQRGEPALDPARHAGSAAGERLQALLQQGGAGGAELLPVYRTDVRRTHRQLRSGGALIEIAFDEGHIRAGKRHLAVCELEFELLSGPPAALIALASRWVQRHGLWLDVRTKSERGHRLARGLTTVPAVRAAAVPLDKTASTAAAFGTIVHAALAQILPNAAEVAGGSGQPEHLHQLRVGLRRLRSALRLFAGWSGDADRALALEQSLREPFNRLGAARDQDALAASLLPALAAAGGPPLPALPAAGEEPAAVLHEAAFTLAMLQALQMATSPTPAVAPAALTDPARPPEPSPKLREAARRALQRSWRKAMADADIFATAEVDAQHRTRKRLKRFRYGAEFVVDLFPGKATARTLAALRQALEALGAYNDSLVAEQRFAEQVEADPRAWFALGWLASHRQRLLKDAARSLRRLGQTPRFWR